MSNLWTHVLRDMDQKDLQSLEQEANKELKIGPNLICAKGKHSFIYQSASEIECINCGIGYPISPGTELKDGNITIHGEELVI